MRKTILTTILNQLGVPFTCSYANDLFGRHPYRYTLYGVRSMLKHYGIESAAVRIDNNMESLIKLQDRKPFVAQLNNDLVVVSEVNSDTIKYISYGKQHNISTDLFLRLWSGITMIITDFRNAVEPEYDKNLQKEWWKKTERIIIVSLLACCLASIGIHSGFFRHLYLVIQLAFCLLGMTVSAILIADSLKINNPLADRLCRSKSGNSCKSILELPVAKLFGRYGWGEIGFSYFVASALLILILPETASVYLPIISILAMPYPVWSIWYQKFVAKKWCALCLLVQGILVSQFVNSIIHRIAVPSSVSGIIFFISLGLFYVSTVIVVHLSINIYIRLKEARKQTQQLTMIKYDDIVMDAMLQRQNSVAGHTSSITFGPSDARYHISLYANPLCAPCVKIHNKVEELYKAGCQIRYYFNSFNDEVAPITHKLISYYFTHSEKETWDLFHDWYSGGYTIADSYFDNKHIEISEKAVHEAAIHKEWANQNRMQGTPTLLFENHHLPREYNVDDIIAIVTANNIN